MRLDYLFQNIYLQKALCDISYLYKKEHDYIPKFAEGLCEIGDAIQSKEKDLWGKVGKFGVKVE